jgi:hypothetical protein
MDIRDLKFDNESFDAVIDKGFFLQVLFRFDLLTAYH